MTKNNNNPPKNSNNQNYNYGNNNQNNEQNYNEFYQNNNQYYNQNQYLEQDDNLGNYNQQYNNYNQEYDNYNQNYYNNQQNYGNYNQNYNQYNTQDNLGQNQYSTDYNYNLQNNNQYYNEYQQNNQNYNYSEQDYNNYQNNYNQNYQQDNPQNFGYTEQDYINAQNNYNQNYQQDNSQNFGYFEKDNTNDKLNTYNQNNQQSNLNHVDNNYNQESNQNRTTEQKTVKTYSVNQTNSKINGVEENTQTYASTQQNNFNNYQQNPNTYQNSNDQNREVIPPIPPVMNPKNFNNSPSNTKKKSKGKLVATISSLLGILLLAGGGYYYYSKNAKQKVVNENEIYGTVLKKYKEAINNPDNADSSINVEALKAALKEKKNDDYIKYVFYDIDGNGRKELIISRNDKPNNPFDIYTFDKNHKVIRLFNPETIDSAILNKLGIDGANNNSGSAVFKDKTIKIRKFDKDTGEYNFLKFSKDGDKLEKTNVITFTGLDTDDSKYKDITNNKEYNSKKEFNDTFPISEVMKFDGEHWKSVKKFGESSSNESNDKKDNNHRKKPDNYETAYASVLKNYKDAISSGKNDAKDVNTVAIGNYKVFGEKQVGNNFLNYGFFDINSDGVDELLLFTEASKDKPNEYSPMDVYTLDKDNKVVRITPERVNGERTTLSITKDKVFQVYGSGGAQVHGYTFYKLNNDGLALEKTDSFDFDGVTNSKVYKRSYPSGKNEEIPVNDFRDKVVNSNNHIKFDFGKRKSIFDFKG